MVIAFLCTYCPTARVRSNFVPIAEIKEMLATNRVEMVCQECGKRTALSAKAIGIIRSRLVE